MKAVKGKASLAGVLALGLHATAASSGLAVGAGANISSFSRGEGYSSRVAGSAGVSFENEAFGVLYLAPGIHLETRGERETFVGGDATLKCLYVQAPLHALLRIPVGNLVFDLFAGPSLGFNVLAELETRSGAETRTKRIRDEMNYIDAGLEAGAGVEIPVNSGHLFVRSSLYNGWTHPFPEAPETQWRTLQVKMGWRFPIRTPSSAYPSAAPSPAGS